MGIFMNHVLQMDIFINHVLQKKTKFINHVLQMDFFINPYFRGQYHKPVLQMEFS